MPVSVHRGPLNMGTTLASRITQYSSKDSWLNWSASVTISSSSSSSSLPWEALLSDVLELDWSSLEFKQTVLSQLHSQHYLTMLEVTLSTQGWKGPCWILDHFFTYRKLPAFCPKPFGYSKDITQWSLSMVRALCWRTQGTKKGVHEWEIQCNATIVQDNSEQKFELYHLCLLTTKLKMQQNPNLFPRCA